MDTSNSRLVEILYSQSRQIKHYVNKQRIEDFAERIFRFLFLTEEDICFSRLSLEAHYGQLKTNLKPLLQPFVEKKKGI